MREASARDRERKSAKVGVSFSISEVGSEGGNARYAVEVLRDLRGKTGGLEDTVQPRRVKVKSVPRISGKNGAQRRRNAPEDLVTGDRLDLGDTVRVTEDDADLRRGETLAGELEDVLLDLLGRGLEPARSRALVRERRTGLSCVRGGQSMCRWAGGRGRE